MAHYSDQGSDGIEWLDWLFDQNDGILRHEESGNHGNQLTWLIQDMNMLQPAEQADSDFLNVLLSSRSDSASGSPLWSPSCSDSGISEDPLSDQMDSPRRPESPPPADARHSSGATAAAAAANATPTHSAVPRAPFCIDLSNTWETGLSPGTMGRTAYSCAVQAPQHSAFPLTVKDLLLSGTQEPPQQPTQQSVQELVLNDDEKKLLVKEGVSLPNQLPLTKHEERILKKIRRKIRNKQSAQESRKKKKEYIDGLESRMATYNTHNQELQRKVFQLEKCNTSLIEQLRRLQALVMNSTSKPAQAGTCVLVLLLSFSLILFPSLRPFSDTKVSQGDFGPVRIHSRSLHSLQAASQVQHVTDHPFPSPPGHDNPPREDLSRDHMDALMETLGRGLANLGPAPLNHSHKGEGRGFPAPPGDPITGHIATVTLDPYHRARPRPHADDM